MNYLISFGDEYFKYKKQKLKKDAELTEWFDEVIIHSPETISTFLTEHKNFVENSRGYGYWIWKPYIILKLLEKINEGDVVVYMDSGGDIVEHKKQKFDEYLKLLDQNPIIVFSDDSFRYKEKYFQKMSVLKRFNLENNEDFLNSGQIEGGVFICKKCEESISFVKEWFDLITENNYCLVNDEDSFPQYEEFISHRHDQSILSILSKQRNVNILSLSECYGLGPFFSSRMTDDGLRPFAPDRFRREPEYDINKHFNWTSYLQDENVKEITINEIKKLFVFYGGQLPFCDINYDIKHEFLKNILVKVDNIQHNKGVYKIYLSFDESPENIAQSKEILVGEFYCQFVDGTIRKFNFQITSNEISFPETKPIIKKMYKTEYVKIIEYT